MGVHGDGIKVSYSNGRSSFDEPVILNTDIKGDLSSTDIYDMGDVNGDGNFCFFIY